MSLGLITPYRPHHIFAWRLQRPLWRLRGPDPHLDNSACELLVHRAVLLAVLRPGLGANAQLKNKGGTLSLLPNGRGDTKGDVEEPKRKFSHTPVRGPRLDANPGPLSHTESDAQHY